MHLFMSLALDIFICYIMSLISENEVQETVWTILGEEVSYALFHT